MDTELDRLIDVYAGWRVDIAEDCVMTDDCIADHEVMIQEAEQAKQNLLKYIEDNYISKH